MVDLIPHPEALPGVPLSLSVEVTPAPGGQAGLALRYILGGDVDSVALPPADAPRRGHELWLHTCFEAFVRVPGEEGYLEYNFAPSRQWAMYRLDGYRHGLTEVYDLPVPHIGEPQVGPTFELAPVIHPDLSRGALVALTAVIEERDGTKSYWSLRHPPGPPDFHHPDCFALTLEAPTPS